MATILDSNYRTSLKQFSLIDDSRGECSDFQIQRMVGAEICRSTGTLARVQHFKDSKSLQVSQDCIRLLAKYAVALPREEQSSVEQYAGKIHRAVLDAETKEAAAMSQELEALRIGGYEVFPRNEAEIQRLIDVKRSLMDLRPVFAFCCEVEKLANTPNPNKRAVEDLCTRLKEVDREGIQALEKAKRQLDQLENNAPARSSIFEDSLIEMPTRSPVQPVSSNRKWVLTAAAGSGLFLTLALLYRRIFG